MTVTITPAAEPDAVFGGVGSQAGTIHAAVITGRGGHVPDAGFPTTASAPHPRALPVGTRSCRVPAPRSGRWRAPAGPAPSAPRFPGSSARLVPSS
ncbi:hypothetical protein GCM10010282_53310 [Streptomyces roseolus]|nr:hypothetical protein GCM10010282_53310 [Streptomyces roseolus]